MDDILILLMLLRDFMFDIVGSVARLDNNDNYRPTLTADGQSKRRIQNTYK